MTGIYQVIYASKINKDKFTSNELQNILDNSRINNPCRGLTGLLISNFKYFFQVLEGQKAAVQETLSKIKDDPRHSYFTILIERTVADRDFYNWSMGFLSIDKDLELVGAEEDWTKLNTEQAIAILESAKRKSIEG